MFRTLIHRILDKFGYKIIKSNKDYSQTFNDQVFQRIYEECAPYTLTSIERMYGLHKSVSYIVKNNIPGVFVECGVWRGGCAMMIAKTLTHLGVTDRDIYLYDTYEGMSEPTDKDWSISGQSAKQMLAEQDINKPTSVWCFASLEDVKANMALTHYNPDRIKFIRGKVEDTLPSLAPNQQIALLRLDTDWYESTLHELRHLYPLLTQNGILIIDDYGHWSGCRQAVDEYFSGKRIFFNRIDYTGIAAVKTED